MRISLRTHRRKSADCPPNTLTIRHHARMDDEQLISEPPGDRLDRLQNEITQALAEFCADPTNPPRTLNIYHAEEEDRLEITVTLSSAYVPPPPKPKPTETFLFEAAAALRAAADALERDHMPALAGDEPTDKS